MTSEELLQYLVGTDGAEDLVSRIRSFILDLAIRGRLSRPDGNDPPSSDLLELLAKANAETQNERRRQYLKATKLDRALLPFTVPRHWSWAKLVDIADVSYGFAFPSGHFNTSRKGLPLIRIRDISASDTEAYFDGQYDRSYIVSKGDYLVGMDGDFNLSRWAGADALLNQRVMRINGWRCGILPEFVRIPLQFILDYLHGDTSQTTVKHLSAKQVNGILIPLPPIPEQTRIVQRVEKLMSLCDELEATEREFSETRDRLSGAAYSRLSTPAADIGVFQSDSQFVLTNLQQLASRPSQIASLRDCILGLAVSGKLLPQNPNDEPAARLLAKERQLPDGHKRLRKILKKRPLRMDGITLPELPSTWEYVDVQSLYDVNAIIDYADGNHGSLYPRSGEFGASGATFVTAKNLAGGHVQWATCKKLNNAKASKLTKGWAKGGDVLLTHNATVGRVARVEVDAGRFLLGTSVTFYRLNPSAINSDYFYYLLLSPIWQGQMQAVMEQTTRNQVSIQKQARFAVPVPPLAEQARIAARLDDFMALCVNLEESLNTCSTLRAKLLFATITSALQAIDESLAPTGLESNGDDGENTVA